MKCSQMSEVETSMKGPTASTVVVGNQKLEFRQETFGVGGYDGEGYELGFTHNDIAKLAIASGLPAFLEVLGWELRHFKISEV